MPRKPAKHPAKPKRGKKLEIEEPGVLYGRYSSHNQKDISVEQQFEKGYELGRSMASESLTPMPTAPFLAAPTSAVTSSA